MPQRLTVEEILQHFSINATIEISVVTQSNSDLPIQLEPYPGDKNIYIREGYKYVHVYVNNRKLVARLESNTLECDLDPEDLKSVRKFVKRCMKNV